MSADKKVKSTTTKSLIRWKIRTFLFLALLKGRRQERRKKVVSTGIHSQLKTNAQSGTGHTQ